MFDAYGDESCDAQTVSYGVFLLPEANVASASNILDEIKREFGGAPHNRLHCRELFAGDARKKSAWAHLKTDDVAHLYKTLMIRLRDVDPRSVVAIAKRAEFPEALPSFELIEPNSKEPANYTKPVRLDAKQLAAFCAQGAMIPISKNPGLNRVRFWPDPDDTSIEWFDRRRQMTGAIHGFVDRGTDLAPAEINPLRIQRTKPSLLEIADSIAYFGRRRLTARFEPTDIRIKAIYAIIDPEEVRFSSGVDGGFGFSVREK
jgi:hypothetical protein